MILLVDHLEDWPLPLEGVTLARADLPTGRGYAVPSCASEAAIHYYRRREALRLVADPLAPEFDLERCGCVRFTAAVLELGRLDFLRVLWGQMRAGGLRACLRGWWYAVRRLHVIPIPCRSQAWAIRCIENLVRGGRKHG